jgi:hypothetical protein
MRLCSAGLLIVILAAGGSLRAQVLTSQVASEPSRDAKPRNPALAFVIVRHVRLIAAPPIEDLPSALMRFDVQNQGVRPVLDVDVRLILLATSSQNQVPVSPQVLAGPFTIRTKRLLMPGERFDYEIRLRNLTSDCDCLAKVDVVEAHFASQP